VARRHRIPFTVADRASGRLMSRRPVDNFAETVRLWTTICQWHRDAG